MEFALILPVLCLFLFGIVQFGLAFDRKQSINSSAREGARLAALDSATLDDIATRAQEAFAAAVSGGEPPTIEVYGATGATPIGTKTPAGTYTGVSSSDPAVMPCGKATPDDFVRVRVSTPFELTIPFFGVQTLTIDAEGQFRCE